ncbi:MAG: hypothetical protein GY841_04385 [FCB group bacterium]|nr:hypothetical protein [FCB group bacterium]
MSLFEVKMKEGGEAKVGFVGLLYITLWILMFKGEPDLIDAVIHFLMNLN